jgi:hypothetical protein
MSKFVISPREVEARKIAKVEPLLRNGSISLAGVTLVLEDGTSVKWTMPSPLEKTPKPNDWLVRDEVLNLDYIVSEKFEQLFHAVTA